MTEFLRFPRTPHLAWLADGQPRGDKLLAPHEVAELLSHEVVVEEKLDGANIGISIGADGDVRVQNRGAFLTWDALHPQFRPLRQWIAMRRYRLSDALGAGLILFGEWCYAKHSVHYTRLPDWFIAFDVYDRAARQFWSVDRRNVLARELEVTAVPEVARGTFDLPGIKALLGPSHFADEPAEGLYVRWDERGVLERRAKLVRAEFTQAIDEHWSAGGMVANCRVR